MENSEIIVITVKIPITDDLKLRICAAHQRTTKSEIVRQAIQNYLDTIHPEVLKAPEPQP